MTLTPPTGLCGSAAIRTVTRMLSPGLPFSDRTVNITGSPWADACENTASIMDTTNRHSIFFMPFHSLQKRLSSHVRTI